MPGNVEHTANHNSTVYSTNNYTPTRDDISNPTGPKENERFAIGAAQQSKEECGKTKETPAMASSHSLMQPPSGNSVGSPEEVAAGSVGLFGSPAAATAAPLSSTAEPVDNNTNASERFEDSPDSQGNNDSGLWSGIDNINEAKEVPLDADEVADGVLHSIQMTSEAGREHEVRLEIRNGLPLLHIECIGGLKPDPDIVHKAWDRISAVADITSVTTTLLPSEEGHNCHETDSSVLAATTTRHVSSGMQVKSQTRDVAALRELVNRSTCEDELIQARELAKAAAGQGCVRSLALLGTMHYKGQGGATDLIEAARCYQIAANAEVPEVMFPLALMYYFGEGDLCANRQIAYEWARLVMHSASLPEADGLC